MHCFGSKRRGLWPIPSLKTLCTMAICDHLDLLTSVGDVPDELILPVLARCTPEQLMVVETHTERKLPTADLWQRHCERLDLGEEEREHNGRKLSWRQVWKNEQKRLSNRKEQVALRLRAMYEKEKEAKVHRSTKHISAVPKARAVAKRPFGGGGAPAFVSPTTARSRLAKKIGASPKSAAPPIISPVARKLQLGLGGATSVSRPLSSPTSARGSSLATARPSHFSSHHAPSSSSSSSSSSYSPGASRTQLSSASPRRPATSSSSSSSPSSSSYIAKSSSHPQASSSRSSLLPSSSRTPMASSIRAEPPLLPVVSPPAKRKKRELNLPSFNKLPNKAQRQK